MVGVARDKTVENELIEMLSDGFPGITVEVVHSERWNRMSVIFRWSGFADLLPEERFQRLVSVIPDSFRASRLAGFVWLELAPNESIDVFLKHPRSEDVVEREGEIYARLSKASFFAGLKKSMGRSPQKACGGDFARVAEVLSAAGWSAEAIRDTKLVFIRHGAYCDCQIVETVAAALREHYAD